MQEPLNLDLLSAPARDPQKIPVISLWQPYASLIFVLRKLHETRHWRYPDRLHGKVIAVHAALKMLPARDMSPELRALCVEEFGVDFARKLPRGAILGTARLSGCAPTEAHLTLDDDNRAAGDWSPGRFSWALTSIMPLDQPVVEKGRQGWWSIDAARLPRPVGIAA